MGRIKYLFDRDQYPPWALCPMADQFGMAAKLVFSPVWPIMGKSTSLTCISVVFVPEADVSHQCKSGHSVHA